MLFCYPNPVTIAGQHGTGFWLRVATPGGEPPCGGSTPQEGDDTLELSGLQAVVAVQSPSWSTVKGLFR